MEKKSFSRISDVQSKNFRSWRENVCRWKLTRCFLTVYYTAPPLIYERNVYLHPLSEYAAFVSQNTINHARKIYSSYARWCLAHRYLRTFLFTCQGRRYDGVTINGVPFVAFHKLKGTCLPRGETVRNSVLTEVDIAALLWRGYGRTGNTIVSRRHT